ncbi:hypothetical protein KUTeg_013345 [Tegillarca granosa]|uniref:Lysosomal-trafficking regulator n=1 Tax=Tegillarca granosa TaxID=220873 RepID=A0ABQ9EWX3_TEGGR|nr:hypothetical protein KUTeg_013345 [Tegillarca granosa]
MGLPSQQRFDSSYLAQNPVVVKSMSSNAVSSQKHYGLEKAIMETGGLEAILFLTAKVYEDNNHDNHEKDQEHELLQAKALHLLFTLVNHSSTLAKDFVECNGYCLLSKVLTSSRSIVGYHTLKVLMDASTTEPVFRCDPETGNLILRRKSEAMVKNITVITDLILNWKIWEGAEEGVHLLLFLSLASLVREDHHYQRFNVIQFQSVNLISKIFCNYQERIQDGCPSFSPEISQCVISILQSMMGTPPDLHLIVAICDFLLLVHPAANTYISHSQSGFYFSLDCDTPTGPVTHWNQDIRNKLPHPANMSTPIKQDNDTDLESKHGSEKKKKLNFEEVGKYAEKEDMYPKLNEMSPKEMVDMGKTEKQISDDTDVPPTILDFVKGDKATSEETCDSAESALDFSVDVISNEASESESKDQKSHSEIETVSDLEEAEGQTKVHKLKPGSSNVSLTLADFCEIEDGKYSVSLDAGSASGGQSSQMFSDTDSEFSIIGMLAPKTDVHFDKNIEILEHEKGLIALCVGLLQTLVTIVVTLPDNLTDKVLQKIIKTEILIVLAHNSSPEIRTAVLRLLNAYLTRASSEHIENFIQKNGFHLLGAQLYQYPTHEEQLQEVMSLILGKPFCLQDRIDTNYLNINDISEVQQSALILFLSVLENTVSDVALCHNALCIALQMFEGAPLIGSLMLEHGFFTVLCNMVIKINRSENSGTDLDGINENQIILEDLQTIICNIAVREFSASGTIHQQQFEEVLDFLYYIELKEQKTFGIRSVQVQTLKTLQLNVILAILQYIEKASQENKHSSGWLSRQTSSPNVSTDNDLSAHFSQLSTSFLQTKRHNFSTSSLHQGTTRSSQAAPPLMKYSASTSVLIDPRLQDVRSGSPTSECESSSSSLQSLYPPISCSVSSDSSKFPSSPKSGFSFPFRFGKKKRLQIFPASQSDLIDRFKKILITSVDLVVFSNKEEIKRQPNEKKMILLYEKPKPVAMETSYIKRLFDFMYRAFEMTLAQDKNSSRRNRYVIMWGAKDVTRVQLGRLMVYMISNKHDFDDRTYVMSYMLGESRGQEILKKLLTTQELGNEMAFYLHDLLTVWEDWCNTQQREDAFRFLNIIKRAGFTVVSPSVRPTHQELEYLREEKKQLDMNVERGRQVLQKKREPAFTRLLHKNDKLCTQLSALAMEVTQSVTQLQTLERNKFVEHIKRSMTKKIQIKKCWQQIVQNLTHERAVWYCPESYPRSWQLDPTEGPGRVRKRLKRCHLGIDSCFLSEEYRHNLDSEKHDPPLIYLFEDDHQMSDSAALIYQLYKNEKIQHTYKCTAVAPNSESRGELLVGENSVFFVADEAISDANYTQVLLGNKDQLSMTWPYEDLQEIHKRWFQLRDIGIEIFLTSGKTCLLACQSKQDRDSLYQHIKGLELPNLVETENLTLAEIQRSWVEGYMTNFDYLTHLNKLAGRSFNDLMQYPVFPFILKEYTTDDLNLKDPGIYRNLSKPISVQEKSREQKYLDNYRILEEEYKKSDQDNISGMRVAPFHYGSHYSNSGSVLHFLVRLPPYTKMFLNFQDNNFDIPDRTFHSMQTTWRLASYQSTSDAKELIPEFFFLPEIFVNSEGFKFGQRQNGEVVWDIQLPPWCKSNPRLFTLIHRQALESDYVSQNLHNWIDLVFGSKQQGELAIKAINVFHPATYFGIDVNSVRDPVKRHALRTMVKTYGQTPKQLFRNPHPQRVTSQSLDNPVSSGVLTQLFQNSFSASTQMDQGHLPYIKSPLNTVTGLKWGSYVGSPHLPPPTVVWQEKFESSVASLEASPTGDVFGVGADSFCLMMHSKQKVLRVFNSTDVVWAAIISWKHPDGILRIKNHKEKPLVNFMHESPTDLVTCCASLPDCRLLFVGGSSGLITIYQTVFNTSKESNIQVRGSKTVLLGHKATVNCLVVCKPYSILISASDDHTCIIWDLNRLCYVRSIDSHKAGVKVVAISPTLGDIASCSPQGMGSRLDLHTVNAELVATKYCDDTINCLAFSSAPEGKSVNIIAGGLSSGNIRIWSSWDLSHLRDLQQDNLIARPVISLTFTHDSQRLYMSTSDGTVSLWESPPFGRLRPHNFTAFL